MTKRKCKTKTAPEQLPPAAVEAATLWVFQQTSGGQLPCLCVKARKYMLCVTAGGGGRPVRVIKRPVEEFARCRVVQKSGKPYLPTDAIDQLKKIGDRNGITVAASKVLLAAREKALLAEEEFNDEEELESMTNESPAAAGIETTESTTEETTMSKKAKTPKTTKTAKKAAPKKAAPKKAAPKKAAPKKAAAPKGPSRISRAVEWMAAEVKKAGGHDKLERGFRKELLEKAAAKFDLAVSTCSIQYNKQVVGK